MEKEVRIIPPEGYEIDKENSSFEKIVFKKKENNLTYEDIAESLFLSKSGYFINNSGKVVLDDSFTLASFIDSNNSTSEDQLKCILAKNKLANVARYLNGDWNPDPKTTFRCWTITTNSEGELNLRPVDMICPATSSNIIFKDYQSADYAIKILGKEEIKKALKPLY